MTSRAGRQGCPGCGAEVDVEAPPGMTPPPPGPVPLPSEPLATPWTEPRGGAQAAVDRPAAEDPARLGFLPLVGAMLWSPRVVLERAESIPAGRALRFGYLCTMWGLLGLSVRAAMAAAPEIPADANAQARCLLGEAAALHEALQPFVLARLPLSPLLALALSHGLVRLFHLVVTAMGRTGVPREDAARLVGLSLAPMAVAALPVVAFGGCLIWSMVLCALALQRVYKLPLGLATGVAALPVFAWAAWELLWQVKMALPCLSVS